jgi:hypothetical protein
MSAAETLRDSPVISRIVTNSPGFDSAIVPRNIPPFFRRTTSGALGAAGALAGGAAGTLAAGTLALDSA